jgi:16S rRNA (guanine966-N2)-methyltransferase
MRIIGGVYRGKRLKSPLDSATRPTSDRIKENLFNILSNCMIFQDIAVLDLFAGSGALGIEALSRGAKKAVFVDNHLEALKILKENIKIFHDKCFISPQNVFDFLSKNPREPVDLIFIDPPYGKIPIHDLLETIKRYEWLKGKGLIVVETAKEELILENSYRIKDHRIYGKTALWFLEN